MRPTFGFPRGLRVITATLAFGASLALTGCGTHDLILKVDILSFVHELQTPILVPDTPAIPGGIATGEQDVVTSDVNLVSGLGSAGEVKAVSLRLRSIADAATGSATDTLRVYLSTATSPDPTPVITQVVNLVAGTPDTVTTFIDNDPRLVALFKNDVVRVRVTTSGRGPSSGANLTGASLRFTALDAVVTAGKKPNL